MNIDSATEDRHPVCGFIGLGRQGTPIAARIVSAGFHTILWARRPDSLRAFVDGAAAIATSISDLGARCDHVGICVDGDAAVREVCEPLLLAMQPGSRLVIHSTAHPDTCTDLGRQAAAKGIRLIDAPVSGGPQAAAEGQLTVMIGGDRAVVDAARSVIETFASAIYHVGDTGSGQKAKLINNTLLAANMGLVHAAVTAGVDLGLERQQWIDLLQVSSGRSYALEVYGRQASLEAFSRHSALPEKVQLLGEILGAQHSAYRVLSQAAAALSVKGFTG